MGLPCSSILESFFGGLLEGFFRDLLSQEKIHIRDPNKTTNIKQTIYHSSVKL